MALSPGVRVGYDAMDIINQFHHLFWLGDLNYRYVPRGRRSGAVLLLVNLDACILAVYRTVFKETRKLLARSSTRRW